MLTSNDAYELSSELVASIADRLVEHEFQCWFYGDSVGFEGLIAASDYLGDPAYLEFSRGFFRAWAARIEPFLLDDNTAAGHAICEVADRTGDKLLTEAAIKLAHYLHARRKVNDVSITFPDTLRSLREPYGEVELSEEQQEQMKAPGAGIYLDCMHFDPPFYAHLAKLDPEGGWADVAIKEILGYKELLQDEETGLYCHYWLEDVQRSYIRGWGRGQGWALLGLLDVAKLAPKTCRDWDRVKTEALELARTMLRYQLEDGNWHCLVHEPRSGPESSTAAFMASAFYRGMACGILPREEFEEPAARAFKAMVGNLDAEGNLQGVSAAVYSALVEEHYWYVPLNFIVPWGQGPVLTAINDRNHYFSASEGADNDE
ncbi:hypothetical protein E1162_01485 [Rhodobacteraceae bacterium RKSG542]|uniref:glycoside hydrolase family 88 protein n=1 Tax=Pseudovibrio flavus TaxID=2529854 RepID=UPI0012BBF6ED|nr:glycoside hydrolase family 88 protein [Pseudovibrio flavus]MTI15906.1 hypothetical protein [Pseudovibrio flavus]